MRRFRAWLFRRAVLMSCAIAAGALPSTSAFAQEQTPPPDLEAPVQITGRAVDGGNGQPLPGAKVFVLLLDQDRRTLSFKETKSDANGVFTQQTSRSGQYLVWADHGNRTSRRRWREADTIVVGDDGKPPEPVELRLRRAATVRVSVTDEAEGRPIQNAVVHLPWGDLADFKTDARGEAQVEPLPSQRWFIEVWADGYAKQARWLNTENGSDIELALALAPGAAVEGVIRGPDGQPLLGAQVGANVVGSVLLRWFYQPNDGDGRYRIANLPLNAELELPVEKEGYVREPVKLALSGPTTHLDITMDPRSRGGSIKGSVVDSNGRTIRAAKLTNQGNHSSDIREAATDAAGRFLLDDLFWSYSGYQVVVNAKGFAPTVINVQPGPADAPTETKIVLEAGHTISGRVVDEQGRGLGEVLVVWGDPIRRTGGTASTDASGRFQLDSLPADCPLEFIREGYSSRSEQRLPLDGEGLVNVVLSPQGVIRGKVVDARNGEPVPAFNLRITFSPQRLPSDPEEILRTDLIEPGQTFQSTDGSFELSELVLRMPLQVMVDADGYERCVKERVECRTADEARTLEFRMTAEDPATLITYRGRLIDAQGTPIAGAQLRLIAATDRDADNRNEFPFNWTMIQTGQTATESGVRRFLQAATGKDGAFHFERVPRQADVELVWWGKGVTPGRRAGLEKLGERARETMEITLDAPARIAGKVDRAAFRGASQVVLHPTARGVMDYLNVMLTPDQETFELLDLPAGTYRVTLLGPPTPAHREAGTISPPIDAVQVRLAPGEEKEIVFDGKAAAEEAPPKKQVGGRR